MIDGLFKPFYVIILQGLCRILELLKYIIQHT